jgi:N-acetylneuraminic acid mutarotase
MGSNSRKSSRRFLASFAAMVVFTLTGAVMSARAQTEPASKPLPAVTHNTWTSGAALPTPVCCAAAAVLKNEIYLVGGNSATEQVADVQIYNPATNTWSTGVSYPAAISGASAAVVKNVLYVFGGSTVGGTASNAVWAFSPKTKTWTAMADMPTARWLTAAVVEKNIIYVIGGIVSPSDFVATVESYNPATNTCSELRSWPPTAPLSPAKSPATPRATTLPPTSGQSSPPIPRRALFPASDLSVLSSMTPAAISTMPGRQLQ